MFSDLYGGKMIILRFEQRKKIRKNITEIKLILNEDVVI
jgi:hypothetical protein